MARQTFGIDCGQAVASHESAALYGSACSTCHHREAITIGQAVTDLELMAKALDPVDMLNRIEFLPLS